MKRERHGKGKILSQDEIQLLFNEGLQTQRDRCLFAVALFTAARINEVCTLWTADTYASRGQVRSHLTFRKANTKGKLATRSIPIIEDLRSMLKTYFPVAGEEYLFPGRYGYGHITSDSAARILRKACVRVEIEGASSHSFRRTALTQMSDTGIPLKVIAEVSGHRNLSQLNAYLEVKPEQVLGAVASLSILSPLSEGGKLILDDFNPNPNPRLADDAKLCPDSE